MHIDHARSPNPRHGGRAWMEVRGVFNEPVKNQTDVVISIHEETEQTFGTLRPAVVGHLIQMRPECRIVVGVPTKDFDRAWALAAGGRLTHAFVSMTKPHYNVSFSNEPIE
jgi:hypothetical protein